MPRSGRLVCHVSLAFVLLACDGGGGADGGVIGSDGGSGGCEGEADGEACGSGLICVAEACVESACGDGFLDAAGGEQCDDGNDVAFDGCEPATCTFTCSDNAECDDGRTCNGAERCADHICELGTPPGDGSGCDLPAGGAGVCRGGECVSVGCGNGVLDGTEECDDGNDVDRDGCDADCTFSCNEDVDCVDGDVCNGSETCDVPTHACVEGEALDCSDADPCTEDLCDPTDGCSNPLVDADGDGMAPETLGTCGMDCDDGDASVFTGAEELCDGKDNDCNGIVDDGAPTWYIDCDNDGFAVDTSGAVGPSCDAPSTAPAGCSGGGWTSVRPNGAASTDCNDANGDVFPGQTAYFTSPIAGNPTATRYDYDCSGGHTRRYGCVPSGQSCGARCGGGYAGRTDSNPNGCTYFCIIGGSCFSTPPDCGESATYNNCFMSGVGCAAFTASRTQACR